MRLVEFVALSDGNARHKRVFISAESVSLVTEAEFPGRDNEPCSSVWFTCDDYPLRVVGTLDEVVAKLRGE